jgi:prolyl-tRNA synthetase
MAMIGVYETFARDVAAIPVVAGRKSRTESFAGADVTYTSEAMMGDGKALQAGTSHNLGQNFAKAFDILFTDEDGQQRHVWQTSWGVSTRMVGGVIMAHGDDTGLRLPPAVAPVQVVVVPIWKAEAEKAAVLAAADGAVAAARAARRAAP